MGTDSKKKIIVIGGGFAGLNFMKRIDKNRFDVTLIDRNNFHSFPPLFYQVASAGIDPGSICFPLRRELRKYKKAGGLTFHMTRARTIDTGLKTVTTDEEVLHYDKLIIAAGSTNNFFNMPWLRDNVYTLKSIAEANRCRNHIMDRLEKACMESDPEKRRAMLSFVVIGGGPTGVEVAGAIGEMKRYVLPREYRQIGQDEISITLVEGAPRVLPTMSERASANAADYLQALMVNVKLGHNMKTYENDVIQLDNGEMLPATTVIWTAGVKGVDFEFINDTVKPDRGNRIKVDPYCRVEGVNDVYALGDIALMQLPDYPAGHPQVAQVAIQQAVMVARDINRGKVTEAFKYNDKGSMATVGRNRAVVDLRHLHFKGFFAWLTWMIVHLMSLLGMRNKVSVFIDWIWNYVTYSSSTRVLMHTAKYPLRKRWLKE